MSAARKLFGTARQFAGDKCGNVAVIYALAIIPLFIAAGAALDYARAVTVRASMAEALDAAALAVGGSKGLSNTQMQALAQQYFNANYHVDSSYGTPTSLRMSQSGQQIVLSTTDTVPTTILKVAGINGMDVGVSTTVVWGQLKAWVSLVLDNTGSMCASDTSPNASGPCNPPSSGSKIALLKSATHNLLTMLQNASTNPGDVKVAIVPFIKDVAVGSSKYTATWLDWTDWNAANGSCSGYNSNGSSQAVCTVAHCSKSQYTTQYNCTSHYGTWYSAGTWTPGNHNTWTGCVMDRGLDTGPSGDYDVLNSNPVSGTPASYFPAEQYSYCSTLTPVMGLSYDWTALGAKVDAMVASGGTNQTIGLAWGWQALTDGDPLNAGTLPDGTAQYIIILSDGLDTQDRWYGTGSSQSTQVDSRMAAVCTNAKANGVVIYAVYVDIGGAQGNSTVLQNCASDSSKYFDLTSASQITTAFNTIGQQITNLRVAQ